MLPSFSLDYLLDVDWYDRFVFGFLRKIVTEVHPNNHRQILYNFTVVLGACVRFYEWHFKLLHRNWADHMIVQESQKQFQKI